MNNPWHRLVVLGSDWDVYTHAFSDFIESEAIYYIPTFRPVGISGAIQRLHLNPKLNSYLPLPGKGIWGERIVSQIKKEVKDAPVCFLILENWLRMESALQMLPKLRKSFPSAKTVCFAQDLVSRIDDMYTLQHTDTEYVKRYCDLFITFDTNDAKRYDLEYFPTVFSYPRNVTDTVNDRHDMYFLGRNKGRAALLAELCKYANGHNLTRKFLILEDEKDSISVPADGIRYIKKGITYEENLRNVAGCNCIVELLQKSAASPTFRLWEAICFNKKLLTNNCSIKESPFYDSRYVSTFSSMEDIDWEFVRNIAEPAFPDKNPFCEEIKPASLIRFIEKSLDIRIYQ